MFGLDQNTIVAIIGACLILGGATLIGHTVLVARLERRQRRIQSVCPTDEPDRPEDAAAPSVALWVAKVGKTILGQQTQRALAPFLSTMGVSADVGVAVLLILRIVAVLGAAAAALVPVAGIDPDRVPIPLWTVLLASAGIWFGPVLALKSFVSKRTQSIERELPEALEMLVICTEAGLPLEASLRRVVDEMRDQQPDLARELAITLADLAVLPDRESALRRLAERVQLESLTLVTSTMVQTMRFGTPLAKALRVMAGELRDQSIAKLEERANRLPVLLTLPTIVFLLPAIFLVIGGPALLRVLDMLAD